MGLADLIGRPRNAVVSSIMTFPAIDTEGMARRMRLAQRATEQGASELPATSSATFDSVEQEIVNEIENEAKTQFDEYLTNQRTYAARAADTSLQGIIAQLRSVAHDATTDLERHVNSGTDELYNLKRTVIEAEHELLRFRQHHRLTRPIRNQGGKPIKLGVLLIILLIETLLNGYFLGLGSSFGYLGGIFEAVFIAGLNVTIGWAFGRYAITWIVHRNILAKIAAIIGIVLYAGIALSFNLVVAHYRSALEVDPFSAHTAAYQTMLSSPFGIHDVQSWALFLMGCLFSLIAACDGYQWDDPYPHFGKHVRDSEAALDEYGAVKTDLFDELEDVKKGAEQKMDDLTRSLSSRDSEYHHVLQKNAALRSAMANHFDHLETAANTLLGTYRDANRRARKTPPPERFDTVWTYDRPALDTVTMPSRNETVGQEVSRVVLEEAPKLRATLHDAYRKALSEYQRIDQLVEPGDKNVRA